jgi:hypothetical protein
MHEFSEKSFIASLSCVSEKFEKPLNVVAVDDGEGHVFRCLDDKEATALTFNFRGMMDGMPTFEILSADASMALAIDVSGALSLYPVADYNGVWSLFVSAEGDEQTPARIQLRDIDDELVLVDGDVINVMDGIEGIFELRLIEWC